MANEFNKANPASSGEGKAPAQTVASTRLTAEEAEQEFMEYVEWKYPEELVYIFSNIRDQSRRGATSLNLWLNQPPNPMHRVYMLPGVPTHTNSEMWVRLSTYLQKMGYEVTTPSKGRGARIMATINWSGPRRLHR